MPCELLDGPAGSATSQAEVQAEDPDSAPNPVLNLTKCGGNQKD